MDEGAAGCGGMAMLVIAVLGVVGLFFGIGYLNDSAANKNDSRSHLEYTRAQAAVAKSDARAHEARVAAEAAAVRSDARVNEIRTATESYVARVDASSQAFATKVLGLSEGVSVTLSSLTLAILPFLVFFTIVLVFGLGFFMWMARQSGQYLNFPAPVNRGRRFGYSEDGIVIMVPRLEQSKSRREFYDRLSYLSENTDMVIK